MNKKVIALSILIVLLVLPAVGLAGFTAPPFPSSQAFVPTVIIGNIFNFIWPIIAAFIVIEFMIAGFKFFTAQGNETKLNEARHALIWATVGVGVILLAWSIIFIVAAALGV